MRDMSVTVIVIQMMMMLRMKIDGNYMMVMMIYVASYRLTSSSSPSYNRMVT